MAGRDKTVEEIPAAADSATGQYPHRLAYPSTGLMNSLKNLISANQIKK